MMRAISPHALRWIAAAGAAATFVTGISAQAMRGHGGTPAATGDGVRATISDLGPVTASRAAPGLRPVTVPALRSGRKPPRQRSAPPAAPAAPVLTVATRALATAPARATGNTRRVPAAVPAPKPQAKPPATTPGPSFDSSG
jgi:hypothetical protein